MENSVVSPAALGVTGGAAPSVGLGFSHLAGYPSAKIGAPVAPIGIEAGVDVGLDEETEEDGTTGRPA